MQKPPRLPPQSLASMLGTAGDRITLGDLGTTRCQGAEPLTRELGRQALLDRIEAALGRLDADQYGLCLGCGGQIAYRRLDQDPSQTLCARCGAA